MKISSINFTGQLSSRKIQLTGLLFFLSITLFAQNSDITIGKTITVSSKILNEERTMMVYLPNTYNAGLKEYPVLYMLDGRAHFLHGSGIVDFLSRNGMIPEMIVVAITNTDRTRDFSASHVEKIKTSGGAPNFLKFIEKELIPYVEQNFRTLPFRVLMGHSFGGAFATFALLQKPKIFDGYIAISPYLQYDNNYVANLAKKELKSKYNKTKHFYMTIGNEPGYFPVLKEFSDLVNERSKDAIEFKYLKMDKENHGSIPHLSLYHGLLFVFQDWQYPRGDLNKGLAALDNHYKKIEKKYGIELQSPENLINLMGYGFLRNKEIEKAIEVFKENIKRYPNSSNVYDSLGEAYENNNQIGLAKKNYQKAFELGKKENHPNTEIYKTNLDRVSKM